jgi:ribosome maturation factor RimP
MVSSQLHDIVEACAARSSAHLIDLVVRGAGNRPVIEAYIDAEEGVTTELCAAVSREVRRTLDETQAVPPLYDLTVSSPGVDRPLKFPWQYRKHKGRTALLRVRTLSGVVERTGRIRDVDGSGLVLEAGTGNETVAFDTILEGMIQAPW